MSHHVKFVEKVFSFTSPPTFTTPVIDTDSALSASSLTSGGYPAPLTSSSHSSSSRTASHLLDLSSSSHPPVLPTSHDIPSSSPLPHPSTCRTASHPPALSSSSPSFHPSSHRPTSPASPTPFQQPSPAIDLLGPTPSPRHPHDPLPIPSPPLNHHLMQTHSKIAILKPNPKYGLTIIIPPISKLCNVAQALQDPKLVRAIQEEYDALIRNGTWTLVPSRHGHNIVDNKWVLRVKQNPDGSIARYKAHIVVKGFQQRPSIDFHETFNPLINLITIRIMLSIALNHKWGLRLLDVNNVFLNGHFTEEVYMAQP